MRDRFIRFMKDNHAYEEFLEEIVPFKIEDLQLQFRDGGAEFVLQDGSLFWWKDSYTFTDWESLDAKWKSICHDAKKETACQD